MHRISPPDGIPLCPVHEWLELRQGDIFWRSCVNCMLTECSVPGVDRCYFFPTDVFTEEQLAALSFEERQEAHDQCERLTTERCPHCQLGFCSDHVAIHQIICEYT